MRCKDCKYWRDAFIDEDLTDEIKRLNLKRCWLALDLLDGIDRINYQLLGEYSDNRLFVSSGASRDHEAYIITNPEFGCVEFKPKEVNKKALSRREKMKFSDFDKGTLSYNGNTNDAVKIDSGVGYINGEAMIIGKEYILKHGDIVDIKGEE